MKCVDCNKEVDRYYLSGDEKPRCEECAVAEYKRKRLFLDIPFHMAFIWVQP